MTTESHVITYTPAPATDDARLPSLRLTLEPEYVGKRQNRATLSDIDSMIAMARSGLSARNRQIARCRWASWATNGDLIVTIALYVWPSSLDLPYNLTLPPEVTSAAPVLVREPRDTKLLITGSGGEIELPWLLEGADIGWHPAIGVWDEWSRPAAPPAIRQDRARLIIGRGGSRTAPTYGVLHVRGAAVGYRHDLSIRYPTGEAKRAERDPEAPDISVSGADDFDATATWTDEAGETRTETATMTIPECVKALLAECPTGTGRGGSIRVKPADDDQGPVQVYYNSCTGAILDVRRGKK